MILVSGSFLRGAIPGLAARLRWESVIKVSPAGLTYDTVSWQYKVMSQYLPISLTQLLQKIESGDLALPHIQRAFVWEPERVSKFMDSLMKDYPIQPFMFWKTTAKVKVAAEHGVRPYLFLTEPKLGYSPLFSVQTTYGYGLTP